MGQQFERHGLWLVVTKGRSRTANKNCRVYKYAGGSLSRITRMCRVEMEGPASSYNHRARITQGSTGEGSFFHSNESSKGAKAVLKCCASSVSSSSDWAQTFQSSLFFMPSSEVRAILRRRDPPRSASHTPWGTRALGRMCKSYLPNCRLNDLPALSNNQIMIRPSGKSTLK